MMIPQEYFTKVKGFFHGDDKKAWLWFHTKHAQLGMYSPMEMLKLGRDKKLMKLIDGHIEGHAL